jgi:rod shape-determining protein MreC
LSPIQDQDHRPLLLAGPSLGLRLVILGAASIALMVADHRQQYTTVIRGWLSVAAYPFHWAVDAPFSAWNRAAEALATRSSLEADNARLATENRQLKLRLMRFESLEQENRRLREARRGSARVAEKSLVAEILKVDLDPYRQRVLVDRGARDGVFVGQAALDANGIFGQVTRVGPITSEVIMISDPEHAIPVQINRTGVRTIAVGTGQAGRLTLPYLPRNEDVVVGDLLVSSGLGGVYPPGYPVARVTEVGRDPAEPLLSVGVAPLAELDRDPEVLLVWFDNRIAEPEPGPGALPALPRVEPASADGTQAATADPSPPVTSQPAPAGAPAVPASAPPTPATTPPTTRASSRTPIWRISMRVRSSCARSLTSSRKSIRPSAVK